MTEFRQVVRKLFDSRAAIPSPASPEQLEKLTALRGSVPIELLELLSCQNGEVAQYNPRSGITFLDVDSIIEYSLMLEEMIDGDETLPVEFRDFSPFLSTVLKTHIGVFSPSSKLFPGAVVEIDYESGDLINWADSIAQFLRLLNEGDPQASQIGSRFPAVGVSIASINDIPDWMPE